jgi:hypothetical protein
MTAEEYQVLVSQMHILVREEVPAWEIQLGSGDHIAGGHVTHGPWRASDCAEVLNRWAQAGLVGIIREVGWPGHDRRELSAREVQEILSTPDQWPSLPIGETGVWWSLVASDRGMATVHDEWVALAPKQGQGCD